MGEMNMNQTTQPEVSKKLTKKDITKSMWIYYAGAELSNSYERLQSLVFCASMTPILKKLYSTDEELSEALKRHLVFFNTEGILGAIIQGIVISMEEQKSNGENITDDAITGIKTGLMGPVAGMGDAIIWAAVMLLYIPSVCIKWFCARRNYAVDFISTAYDYYFLLSHSQWI